MAFPQATPGTNVANPVYLVDGNLGNPLLPTNGSPVNVAQWNGAAVGLTNPVLTEDQIRALIINGQGFIATSGLLSTLTTANAYIALGLLASAIAKNVYIYRVSAMVQNVTGDIRLASMTAFDANVTAAVTPANNNLGSSVTPLAVVKSTPNSNTAPTATTGTTRNQVAGTANGTIELIQQGSGIFIPANSTQGITAWVKIPTAANTGAMNIEWVEF